MSVRDEDIEHLIDEVEKRPPLYLKAMKEYSDINLKKKLLDEVILAVAQDWNNLSPEEKIKQGSAIQKKWHNLRSCFSRELRAQQATKSGQAASKRRKYVYFDRLLFLLPDVQQRPTASNLSPVNDDVTEEDNENDDSLDNEEAPPTPTPNPRPQVKGSKKKECYEEQLLKVLKEKKNDLQPTDEETNFALSLVPTLKSLPEENKLQARIEILGVLQRMKLGTQAQSSSFSPQQYHHMDAIPPSTSTHQYQYGGKQYHNLTACSPQSNVSEQSARSYYSGFSGDQPEGGI